MIGYPYPRASLDLSPRPSIRPFAALPWKEERKDKARQQLTHPYDSFGEVFMVVGLSLFFGALGDEEVYTDLPLKGWGGVRNTT